MKSRKINLFILAGLLLLMFCQEALAARRVRVKAVSKGAVVKLTAFARIKGRKNYLLEFQRNDGAGFLSIALVAAPGRKEIFADTAVSPGVHRYRIKLSRAKRRSFLSKAKKLKIKPVPPGPTNGGGNDLSGEHRSPLEPAGDLCAVNLPEGVAECPSHFYGELLHLVNAERAINAAPALSSHPALDCSSKRHTLKMISDGQISHDGWYENLKDSGFLGRAAGQNVAAGYPGTVEVMSGWLSSSGHRRNILSQSFSYIGISCLTSGGISWWTQDFGG